MAKVQFKAKKTEADKLRDALMTGVSYMLPLVVAGGLLLAIGSTFETTIGLDLNSDSGLAVTLINDLKEFGLLGLQLLFPIIAAYIGFGLGGKSAIAPGLITGLMAREMGMGFIGAVVAGLLVGYLVRWMVKTIKLPKNIQSLLPMFIIPLIGTAIAAFIMKYVVGYPLIALNTGLENWLLAMSGTNKILMAAIMGAMVGFDLGGPVNKAAITVSFGMFAQGIYEPVTASHAAIMVAPFGIGLSTILAKQLYTKEMQDSGKAAMAMSCVGISEGAIPFVLSNPALIAVNMIGCAITAAGVIGLNTLVEAPAAGILAWFLAYNTPLYILSVAAGVGFVALGTTLLTKRQIDKKKFREAEGKVAGASL